MPVPPDLIALSPLAGCPTRPGCVSSLSWDPVHRVEPFHLCGESDKGWQRLIAVVFALPRTIIIANTPEFLLAECRSPVFGFIDDLSFLLLPLQGRIEVRSASRRGFFDFGVNRRRVEKLGRRLAEEGVLQNYKG